MSEQLEKRSAGRGLDAEIAERVFGAKWYPTPNDMNYREALWLQFPSEGCADMGAGWVLGYRYADATPDVIKSKLPRYSTDIAAAFQVVEAMNARDICASGFTLTYVGSVKRWAAGFAAQAREAETAPLAICLAALAALDAETPPPSSAVENSPPHHQP